MHEISHRRLNLRIMIELWYLLGDLLPYSVATVMVGFGRLSATFPRRTHFMADEP